MNSRPTPGAQSVYLNGHGRLRCQVAAVCFRRNRRAVEFLLVRTNKGRWTFPKGQIHPTLGPRKSAQMEALEEAGAYGVIDEEPFHTYICAKGVFWKEGGVQEYPVLAFLLEVTHHTEPEQDFREPTWFTPGEAGRLLAEGREHKYRHETDQLLEVALELTNEKKSASRRSTARSQ